MDVAQQNIGNFTISDKNTNPTNWKWDDESRAAWKLADAALLNFRNKWYGNPDSGSLADRESPGILELEHFIKRHEGCSSLFVRPSYVKMFDDVLMKATAMSRGVHGGGIIITGQPGTGKTLFEYYLLVRLLQLKQVVLYSLNGRKFYLFYHDGVYILPPQAASSMDETILPMPLSPGSDRMDGFIWSLFDIYEPREPLDELLYYPCFPVQTTSPNPVRYGTWRKKQSPVVTGLPLWTREELAQGLRHQRAYRSLVKALSEFYAGSSPNAEDPLSYYPGIRALLDGSDGGGATLPQSPEGALEYLLDAVIDRFGYSARDVFNAVFNYDTMTKLHKAAISSQYIKLPDALSTEKSATDTMSDYLLTLRPIYPESPLADVGWEVDFKSDWIAKSVIQKLAEAKPDDVIPWKNNYLESMLRCLISSSCTGE